MDLSFPTFLNIIAVSIAFLSLWIAIWSLRIAIKTLRSQMQTEKNTTPKMSKDIQEFLLRLQISRFADAFMKTTAIIEILTTQKYKSYPSDDIMNSIKMPVDIIHSELFYDDPLTYKDLQGLYEKLISYNNLIDVIVEHLKNNSVSEKVLEKEFERLLKRISVLYRDWYMFMAITYNYDYKNKESFENGVLIKSKEIIETNVKAYYQESNPLTHFITEAKEKQLFTLYMNTTIAKIKESIEEIFIPRKKSK